MDNKQDIYLSVINEYRDKIIRLCFAYLDDRSYVDDIFQDVLLAVWTGLEKFRNEASYGTWIYRITVNTIFLSLPSFSFHAADSLCSPSDVQDQRVLPFLVPAGIRQAHSYYTGPATWQSWSIPIRTPHRWPGMTGRY